MKLSPFSGLGLITSFTVDAVLDTDVISRTHIEDALPLNRTMIANDYINEFVRASKP